MLFNTYEVKCDLIESQIISQSPTDAKVSFVQVMRKVKGPDFKNNQVEGIYTLHRTQSGWQIFQTEVKSVKYLN